MVILRNSEYKRIVLLGTIRTTGDWSLFRQPIVETVMGSRFLPG